MEKNPIILLNIAHSDDTAGKRSPDGKFREWAYSTEICQRVANELESHGFIVRLIKQKTYYGPSKGLKQVVDDANAICNEYGAKNCIFVSIHVNASAKAGWDVATGWGAYTSIGKTKADTLAEDLYWAAEQVLTPKGKKIRKDMSDGDKDYEESFYVLNKTLCPAVLTENFFQNTKTDVAYLESEEGKRDIVKIHVDGILAYIQKL